MAQNYSGVLRKKLPPEEKNKKLMAMQSADDEVFRGLLRKEVSQKFEKLPALFLHYEIDLSEGFDNAVFDLMLCLAHAHVPGFRREMARGAPKQWDFTLRKKASFELGKISAVRPLLSQNAIAAILHKQKPWNELSKTPAALLKQIRLLKQEQKIFQEVVAETKPINRLAELLNQGKK